MNRTITAETSRTVAVLEKLREDITNCVYESGQFITESEISQKFKVSKTPAREALNYLCQDGLLVKIPRKGYIIKQLSFTELSNLCYFRSILECGAVEWAIRYASDSELDQIDKLAHKRIDVNDEDFYNRYNDLNVNFHLSIAQLSKNTYLISALQGVLNQLRRDLAMDGRTNLEKSLEMHIQMVEALKKRDLEQAKRITIDQIQVVEKRLYLH
ncbi:MAG: GntR family transcriptional regulator [Lachnospiraceae bacterium]|jgi:DNA-binding GntR family transcriptional regulator|nr:GntR family transcriptional regulator [Lachnospiraceae bacterium]